MTSARDEGDAPEEVLEDLEVTESEAGEVTGGHRKAGKGQQEYIVIK
jgi:hypothetical protein